MKPFVKSNKNDFLDAEAVARKNMRFVPSRPKINSICRHSIECVTDWRIVEPR